MNNVDPFLCYHGLIRTATDGEMEVIVGHVDGGFTYTDIFKPGLNRASDIVSIFEKPFVRKFELGQAVLKMLEERVDVQEKVYGEFGDEPTITTGVIREHIVFGDANQLQREAIYHMVTQNPKNAFVLYGPARTGKTYIGLQ
uniref:DNA helicase n=1 Tax=Panagrolaimus superbus TaxID=310955 RepID=A0A914XXI8_9BILA